MPAEPPLSSKYIDVNRTEPKLSLKIQLGSNDFGEMGVNVHWLLSVKSITYLNCVFFFPFFQDCFSQLNWHDYIFFFKHMPTFFTEGTSFTGHQKQVMDELDRLIDGDLTAWGRFHRARRISTKPVRGKSCWGLSHTSAARCRETIRPCLQSLPPVGQLDHVLVLR